MYSAGSTAKYVAILVQAGAASASSVIVEASSPILHPGIFDSYTIGVGISWTCAFLYLTSRMPQILKNVSFLVMDERYQIDPSSIVQGQTL
jgi:hypothetical protein